ncbi:hypothetical protein ASG67_16725 [Sphingomonas sp. Leaf339]|nr:hypothetical protein ASG67_16725 [Sphingomonas sp. Leaf339]
MWLALLLTACGDGSRDPSGEGKSPGAKLEAAAVTAGLVPDAARASITGSWARDTDRICVVNTPGRSQRIGVLIEYGDGHGCSASGPLDRRGSRLKVAFGNCRFDAIFDGERINFPATLPAACDALCTGRASLAALEVDRLSDSAAEAATLRGRKGNLLCAT